MRDQTIFLTGGAGSIGSMLVGRLIEHNQMVVFDNRSRDSLRHKSYFGSPRLRLVPGDVTDATALEAAMREADPHVVVHLAAVAGIDTVITSPTRTMLVNLLGTVNALAAACGLKRLTRFVDFSTSEVFGSIAFGARETGLTLHR